MGFLAICELPYSFSWAPATLNIYTNYVAFSKHIVLSYFTPTMPIILTTRVNSSISRIVIWLYFFIHNFVDKGYWNTGLLLLYE